ncbi:MAG: GtrA family protein [Synechococcaceae cyanobacterium]
MSVGGISNGFSYGCYLAMTWLGVNPLMGMTAVYVVASCISFTANRAWTFKSDADVRSSLIKYITIQLLGYATNVALFSVLYYAIGVPHYLAQLAGIVIVALGLFLLSRYYVFSYSSR